MKIERNPFAKGFRDSSRLADFDRYFNLNQPIYQRKQISAIVETGRRRWETIYRSDPFKCRLDWASSACKAY